MRFLMICQVLVLASIIPIMAHALSIETSAGWEGLFAGKVTPYEITIKSKRNQYAHLSWKLKLKGRILSQGEQDIRFQEHDAVTIDLPLQLPPLRPGISLEAGLSIELTDGERSGERFRQQSKLKIYGPGLLSSNLSHYKELNIRLFDPNGNTSKIFDSLKIPYTAVSKSELTNQHTKGLLVVGIGLTFKRQQSLLSLLAKQAGQGDRILVLQPDSGSFPLPGAAEGRVDLPSSLSFSDQRIVSSFAGELAWSSSASMNASGLRIEAQRQAVVVKVVDSAQDGWLWVDINYYRSGGRFIISMLPFDKHIFNGPVPQLIFARLLAYAGSQSANELLEK